MAAEREIPEDEARDAALIHRAWVTSRSSAPIHEALEPMSLEELARPIETNSDELPDAAPATIHGYEQLEEIGLGGQATLYRATQQSTGRIVAIKVIHGGPLLGSRHRLRLEREIEALARLEHPNIVSIIDRGRSSDGSFYLVMQFIEGQQLDTRVKAHWAGNRSPRPLLELFAELCDAVHEAHRMGIIHRDLKPSNVRIDSAGRPHVLDFGLAMLFDADTDLSLTGSVVGSVRWASPEQVFSERQSIGPWSDVYSLGVMLYFALTERMPYPHAAEAADMRHCIASERIAPPSRAARGRGIDSALDELVLRALARPIPERFADAGQMAEAIRQYLRTPPPRRRRWRRFSVGWMCLSAALLCGQLIGRPPIRTEAIHSPEPLTFFHDAAGIWFVELPWADEVVGIPPSTNSAGSLHHEVFQATTIQTAPVTWEQWRRVMKLSNTGKPSDVAIVSRDDALRFCERLSHLDGCAYGLPSQKKLEYVSEIAGRRTAETSSEHPVVPAGENEWSLSIPVAEEKFDPREVAALPAVRLGTFRLALYRPTQR